MQTKTMTVPIVTRTTSEIASPDRSCVRACVRACDTAAAEDTATVRQTVIVVPSASLQ